MPSTYKTPGVYIEEISKFPPSVAQVETAIPAFIGYTEKATVRGIDHLARMEKAAKDLEPAKKAVVDAEAEVETAETALQEAKDTAATDELKEAVAQAQTALNAADDAGKAAAQTALEAAQKALQDAIDAAATDALKNAIPTAKKKVDEAKAALAQVPDGSPVAVRITSLLEYIQFFGEAVKETGIKVEVAKSGEATAQVDAPSNHNMFYSLQAFFANGGGPCYIVSVGKTSATGTVELTALKDGLKALEKEDEVTLLVAPESLALSIDDSAGLYNEALAQCNKLQDRFVVMDARLDEQNVSVFDAAAAFRDKGIGPKYLKYGAAYGPRIETIFDYAYEEKDVEVTINFPEQPDGTPPSTATVKMADINPEKAKENGQFYPLVKSAIGALPVVLPAAPLVVGVYAAVDSDRGVWKAPANVSLSSVVGPTIKISSADQENLNIDTTGKSINAIRAFTGKGTLIWGARTLAGNDNEWRYVPVRRFFNMAEESIKKATEAFVFEPNDANTWVKVKAMIENFLTLQWRAGALAGAKPDQAFYVNVGLNETMTALDILEGRMIIEIGMAVVRPAEFIILKFSHKMQES